MPRRSNSFQNVVALIHRHLAPMGSTSKSEELVDRISGELREVDVVIRTTTAGYEGIYSIEATSKARKADLPWVEAMISKHEDLPTLPQGRF